MKEHPQAEILRAIADGHTDFEMNKNETEGWIKALNPLGAVYNGIKVRIAKPQPKTITGTLTIPEPMRERPKSGERYWYYRGKQVYDDRWDEHLVDVVRFDDGVYATEEEAMQASEAWDNFIRGGRNDRR